MDMIRSMFGPSYASWQAMQAALPQNLQALMPKVDAEALDAVFYDVGLILDQEAALLKEHRAGEGDVLVVQPSASHGRTLEVFHSVKELAAAIGRDSRNSPRTPAPRALALAGVGSSALGAAALARDVANWIGAPVAAVVCSDGLSDVMSEGMGGWFWFGWRNRMLHAAQRLGDFSTALATSVLSFTPALQQDVEAVATLLAHPEIRSIELIVGHSKGNLMLWEALRKLPDTVPFRTPIVTLGARIRMPDRCTEIHDVIGGADLLGELNSHPDIPADLVIPGAGHHTSDGPIAPALQFLRQGKALDVTEVLDKLVMTHGLKRPEAARTIAPAPAPATAEQVEVD